MNDLANPLGSVAGGTDISTWLLPALVIAGLIFGLRMKTMAARGMRASQERSMELSTRLASVDVEALLGDVNAPAKPITPNADAFFANAERKAAIGASTLPEEPAAKQINEMVSAPSAGRPRDDTDPVFEVPTLQDLPRRAPNEPPATPDAAARVKARMMEVEQKRQADPSYKPSRAEQVARYALTAQRRDGGSAVYLKRQPNVAEIRRYKKAAEILGANDLAYILEHSADLVETAIKDSDEANWPNYVASADELSGLFRIANETDQSAGRLVALADAYLARHS